MGVIVSGRGGLEYLGEGGLKYLRFYIIINSAVRDWNGGGSNGVVVG